MLIIIGLNNGRHKKNISVTFKNVFVLLSDNKNSGPYYLNKGWQTLEEHLILKYFYA